jgi:hypothetical protein
LPISKRGARDQASLPGRCLRRVRIAAAARPNSAIIGGAGTSWPPLVLPLDEDEELLLLELDDDELLPDEEPDELLDDEDDDEELLVLLVISPELPP